MTDTAILWIFIFCIVVALAGLIGSMKGNHDG
jgi:hypothetical protein